MKYTYVVAWSVDSGLTLPGTVAEQTIPGTEPYLFHLSRDPESRLLEIDKGDAIRRNAVHHMMGRISDETHDAALQAEIQAIRAERRRNVNGAAVLVGQASGDIHADLGEHTADRGEYVVSFSTSANTTAEIRRHDSAMKLVRASLALQSPRSTHPRFTQVARGLYFTDSRGRAVYPICTNLRSECSVTTRVTPEVAAEVSRVRTRISQSDIGSALRCFLGMTDSGDDALRGFLFGWIGLEIIVNKVGSSIQIAERHEGSRPPKGTYLADKFGRVTTTLFPNCADAARLSKQFESLKRLRDSFLHGRDLPAVDLPVAEVSMLLRKYLRGVIEADDEIAQGPAQGPNPARQGSHQDDDVQGTVDDDPTEEGASRGNGEADQRAGL